MTISGILGIAAGVLGLAANPVYVADILRGDTKPSKSTWWMLTSLHVVLTASYYASGARETLWLPIAYAISFLVVAVLSIRYGEAGWRLTDTGCLMAVGCSGLLWWVARSPQLALLLTVCADFFALIPTIEKAYARPWTENRAAWLMASAAAALNVLAVETWTLSIAAYPAYVLAVNALITLLIIRPRRVRA
jgi:hypothetical protein